MKTTHRLFSGFGIAILVLIVIFAKKLALLGVDWLWFTSLDLETLFYTALLGKLAVGVAAGVLTTIVFFGTQLLFRRMSNRAPIMATVNREGRLEAIDIGKKVDKVLFPVSVLVGIFAGAIAAGSWDTVLLYLHQQPFGVTEPILEKDVAYYVFTLPFFELVFNILYLILSFSFIAAILLYIGQGALTFANRNALASGTAGQSLVRASKEVVVHLSLLGGAWFLLIAGHIHYVRIPSTLFSQIGPFNGASYTVVNAILPFLHVLLWVAIFGAILAVTSARAHQFRYLGMAVILYMGVNIFGGFIVPQAMQLLLVKPNELSRETPFIENHLELTRTAWGLDKVLKRELSGESKLTQEDIESNEATIRNIRLWDREPLLDTLSQLQEIRTYYDFVSVDDDRYLIDDQYRQVLLSARELSAASLPQRNFINERFSFTHGMGVALAPGNDTTSEGLPVLFVQDLPPQTTHEQLAIDRPQIYYGELANDYIFTNTDAQEFDYPSGDENVYSNYEGDGGVAIDSLLKRLLFSFHFSQTKIFLSSDFTSDSKIHYYRSISERVAKAFPFLYFDGDPYLVIADGKLVWLYDAYTVTDRYPYAETIGTISYMRNSVKITVDAYTGKIHAYIADETDPIIAAYASVFPDIFEQISDMSEAIRVHTRYPEDLFALQTSLYTTYHMDSVQNFYNREDEWEIPIIASSNRGNTTGPAMRHLIMKLPEEETEEFILMLPYTPRGKNNMAAWMVARSDGDNYGELIVYRFPKQRLVFGPQQIVNRINQDADISQQISLWDQRGSEVIQGNLFVIPIEESILYVRPLYLRAEGGKIPELKRVIVAFENTIVMGETLGEALSRVFGGTDIDLPAYDNQSSEEDNLSAQTSARIREANRLFNEADAAARRGDWAAYGEAMNALNNVLRQLESAR